MPRPTPWRALIGGIRWTHKRRGEALPRPHPAAPRAAHRPEALPRPAPPTQSSPREANRPALAQCAGAKLLGEIGLGVRRPQIAGIGRIGGGRGVPRPYDWVRVMNCSGRAWCFASVQGADCRCRGTMLGPHCDSLRKGCSRFRGSGAMLSPGVIHAHPVVRWANRRRRHVRSGCTV